MSRDKRRWLLGAIATLVLAFGVAACGDDDEEDGGGAEAPETTAINLQIGDLVPLTGDLSTFGPPGRKAADLAIEQLRDAIQQAGLDSEVSIEHADTETNPQASVQAARRLVSGGASCLTGAWASADTIPVAESVSSRQQIAQISPASTSAEITDLEDNGFVFRTAPSDNLQGQALADVVEEELGGTDFTISLAARNDAYGEGLINRFQEAWEEKGGQTTGPVLYDPEQPSFNSEAGQIVSGNPDAFVIVDFPDTYAKMGAALVRTGEFDASNMFTADGLAGESVEALGVPEDSAIGSRGTRPGTPEQGQVVEQFNELFTGAPGPGRQTFDAQNFDAVMLCFLAALRAGSTEGQDIADNLRDVSGPPGDKFTYLQLGDALQAIADGEDIDFEGVTGPVDFDENGDPTTATYEVFTYQEDGALEVVRQFQAEAAAGGEEPGAEEEGE